MKDKEKQQNELNEAIGRRAIYGQRYGWNYAMKWFAMWQYAHNKKWGI
jgi:hypothetical protein